MKKKWAILTIVLLVLFAVSSTKVLAAGEKKGAAKTIIVTPDDLQWTESQLPNVKMAILEGNPKKHGFFVMRLKLPAGTKVPAHVHSTVERVTVISGKFNLALGEMPENPKVLPAGSYFSIPPKTVHNAWADEETVLQITTIGPWTFKPIKKEEEKKE